jgi:glutathione peroxidase
VTFPLFKKIEVNGAAAHPLYRFMKQKKSGFLGAGRIKWNFTKFLVDAQGDVIQRYAPAVTPEAIGEDLSKNIETR